MARPPSLLLYYIQNTRTTRKLCLRNRPPSGRLASLNSLTQLHCPLCLENWRTQRPPGSYCSSSSSFSQPSLFHFYSYLMDRVRIHLRLESKPRNTWIQLLYTNLVYWELAKLNEQEGNQFEDRLTVIDRWAWYPSQNGLLVNIRNRIQWGLKMYSAKLFSDYERGVGNSFDYWLPTVNSSWLIDALLHSFSAATTIRWL